MVWCRTEVGVGTRKIDLVKRPTPVLERVCKRRTKWEVGLESQRTPVEHFYLVRLRQRFPDGERGREIVPALSVPNRRRDWCLGYDDTYPSLNSPRKDRQKERYVK